MPVDGCGGWHGVIIKKQVTEGNRKSDNPSALKAVYLSHRLCMSPKHPKPRIILGRNVCRLRLKSEMTQEELAEHANIDRRYVQRIEAGTANPGIDIIDRIRIAFRCGWEELLGR